MGTWTSLGVDPEAAEAARLKAAEEAAAAPPVTAPEPAAAAPPPQLATPAQTTPQWKSVPKPGQVSPDTIRKAPSVDMSATDRVKDIGQYYGEGGLLAADSGTFGIGNRALALARGLGDQYRGEGGPIESYGKYTDEQNQYIQKLRAADPARAVGADVVGGAAGGAGLAKLGWTLAKPGVGWIERAVRSTGDAALQGGAQGVGANYGGFIDKAFSGGMGTVLGGSVGAAVPLATSATKGAVGTVRKLGNSAIGAVDDSIPIPVLRAAENERAALTRLPIAEGGRLTDPRSLRLLAQGAATENSPGTTKMTDMLTRREDATGQRLLDVRRRISGEVIEPKEFQAANEALRKTLKPEYDAVWAGSRKVDTEGIANWLEGLSVGKRGGVQSEAAALRRDLNITGTNELDPNPETLHSLREKIDDILYDPKGPPPKGVADMLKEARGRITAELHEKVPGVANVDAKYQEFASRQDAYTYGRDAFDGGKEAIPPRTFARNDAELGQPKGTEAAEVQGPSAAPLASRQGSTYDLDRLLGTTSNDLQNLKTMFKREPYNIEKFKTQYGEQNLKVLQDAIDNNITFREAYQKIVHGSKTAETLAAAKEAGTIPKLSLTEIGSDIYNRYRAGTAAQQRNRIAEIMATEGNDLPALRDRILKEADVQRRRDITRTMVEGAATSGGAAAGPRRYIEIRPGRRN